MKIENNQVRIRDFTRDQFIGEPDYWNRGIGSEFLKMMASYLKTSKGADCWLMEKNLLTLEFKKFTDFPRGTMYDILCDAYSYDDRNKKIWDSRCKKPLAESKSMKALLTVSFIG